jgi:hypothetical protein
MRMSAAYPLAFDFDWQAVVRGYPVVGRGRIWGDMYRMELRHDVVEPVRVEAVAGLDSVLTSRTFTASLTAADFDLQDIDSALAPARVGGALRASGTFSAFNTVADVRVMHAAIGTQRSARRTLGPCSVVAARAGTSTVSTWTFETTLAE